MRKHFVAVATVVIFALLVSPAFAGKGGNGNGRGGGQQATAAPSIALVEPDPHLEGRHRSPLSTRIASTPLVAITCLQVGTEVYREANTADHVFTLGGGWSLWLQNGGPASCAAELYYFFESSPQTGQVLPQPRLDEFRGRQPEASDTR